MTPEIQQRILARLKARWPSHAALTACETLDIEVYSPVHIEGGA